MTNSFGAKDTLTVGDKQYEIYRIDSIPDSDRLPYSMKILLENLLRNEDGASVTADQVRALAAWNGADVGHSEIQFTPARVLLQDFTGVPCVVDLVAMRDAMDELGGDPQQVNPLIPVELVIDHSVIADSFGRPQSAKINADLEFERNRERYQLLRWAQHAFDDFVVVPPDTGICHQVNLEYLARVVFGADAAGDPMPQAYPDTLVGTDSHTPMVNGLGVLGWGVGGIEAEAAMLGQPVSMLLPEVIGLKLRGELREGVTATDMVLTVAELLRQTGVVGKFVELFGPGVANVPLANRATIGNMSPEYGSTVTIFPIDDETLDYLRFTGRSPERVALVEAYAKAQGLWHDPDREPEYSHVVELDLASIEPSIAGPKRPQDRIPLAVAQRTVQRLLADPAADVKTLTALDDAIDDTFPASDPFLGEPEMFEPHAAVAAPVDDDASDDWPSHPQPLALGGEQLSLDNGDVVIAAITSCTNTSNPSVMIGAALLARNAVQKGLKSKPWVKTSLAPGSRVVTDYFERAGLTPYLDELGFHLVGYGCTTCIGNSGPLIEEVGAAVDAGDLTVASVLSGNRNFEGRIHSQTRMNFLASPPLVVAYALAGSMHVDLNRDPLGTGGDGAPVFLKDIWPSAKDIKEVVDACVEARMFTEGYSDVYAGDENWNALPVPEGDRFDWQEDSTYVRRPPYFDGMGVELEPLQDITGARVLAKLGDSVTTDHISPAGSIKRDSPAGEYLTAHDVEPRQFNSYGSRRGNHEVMIRGTFANIRLRNELVPGVEGGFTRVLPGGEPTTIFAASEAYAASGTPLIVLAGKEYGSGSSRDWAAKGTLLLGAKAVLAESFERIHRSNLIGMGVLPLQFRDGESAASLGLDGTETYAITGIAGADAVPREVTVHVRADDGQERTFTATVRIDTPTEREYYRHGGILPYVLRQRLSTAQR
ncbi:aconitate hydratase AcnA [Microbacterium sp. SYP-A9085]|uniref:aconitate hydratase n=1 Tax=Microbacterium sp. SYP-A9085 TaxID=2664454 RepID=UPI00129BFE2C|nr:aconitate hydratase [Microbacterium sp. SYP-A9085]MRH29992.1 aconitate hydratase AcnA [Microbacterium sp. SYP-A9085]